MKAIGVHVRADQALDDRLSLAIALAREHRSQITCLQITPFETYILTDPFGGVHSSQAALKDVQEREADVRRHVEAQLRAAAVPFRWHQIDGDVGDTLVRLSSLMDLVVISRDDGAREGDIAPLHFDSGVLAHIRAPLLIAPPSPPVLESGRGILVAWNGSPEAASSLKTAIPLLRSAGEVVLATVGDVADGFLPAALAMAYLGDHAIVAELKALPVDAGTIAGTLCQAAHDMDAVCIVMGAYGHARWREILLGGVTRDMLAIADCPLLMSS